MTGSTALLKGTAAAAVLMFAAAGCGSLSADGSSGSDAGTVKVDVGTDKPIELTTGKLKVALFMATVSNEWAQNLVDSAEQAAEENGVDLTVLDAGFDVAKQASQLQNAATSGQYDAALVFAVDGVQSCDLLTKTLPDAGVVVSVLTGQICGRTDKQGEEVWAPGTLNIVGGGSFLEYQEAWIETAVEMNPGPQKVAVVLGPELQPSTAAEVKALEDLESENPDFDVEGIIFTDYTTPTTYNETQAYLQAHPDTTLLLSVYSPDLTRGIVQALGASNLDIPIGDIGGSEYSVDQINAGRVQYTLPYTPISEAQNAIEALLAVQDGETPERVVSEFPEGGGTPSEPLIVTSDNVDTYDPEF